MVECDYTVETGGLSYHRTSHAVLGCLWVKSTNPLMKVVVGRLEVRVRLEACHGCSELGCNCAPQLCGKGGEGRGGEGYISGGDCLSGVEHVVSLTFASWLTASPPAATWSTLATAMRIMYWREGERGRHTGVQTHWGTDTPGYRHTGVQTHQGTDTPGGRHTGVQTHRGYRHTGVQTQSLLLLMPCIWNGMDWNVVLTTTSHLVQAIFRAFPTGP